jgi:hypothetical protein
MAIKIRRGTDAQRLTVVLEQGEVAYTTDTKKLYVGDGTTLGGVLSGGGAIWGGISGTLSSQTDLQNALDAKQNSLGFTAENVANKSTSVITDQASNTKYPSVKSVYDWAVGLFATISNLALKTDKLIVANRQTASYTLVLADADKLVEMNVATANNTTVPASIFPANTQILLAQYGVGQTSIVAGAGMTIRSSGGKLKLSAQYAGATLVFISTTEAYLFGELSL